MWRFMGIILSASGVIPERIPRRLLGSPRVPKVQPAELSKGYDARLPGRGRVSALRGGGAVRPGLTPSSPTSHERSV